MKTQNLILGALFLLTISGAVHAASFDCEKATSEVEKLICGNEELSTLDESLSKAYQQALKRTDIKKRTIESQRLWLKNVRNACEDAECLTNANETRILELGLWTSYGIVSDAEADSSSIAGCYYQLVTPRSAVDSRSHPDCSTLQLTPIGKDRYKCSCTVVAGNFHTCSAEGIAVVKQRGKNPVLEIELDEEDTNDDAQEPCKLKIRFTNDKVVVEEEYGTCRRLCGARAAFSDAVFRRKDRMP
jgi:uncharacterized protein